MSTEVNKMCMMIILAAIICRPLFLSLITWNFSVFESQVHFMSLIKVLVHVVGMIIFSRRLVRAV